MLTDDAIEHVFWESTEYSERVRDIAVAAPSLRSLRNPGSSGSLTSPWG